MRCSRTPDADGHIPETLAAAASGPARVDVIAQTLRIGYLLHAHRPQQPPDRVALARLRQVLARQVQATGAVGFALEPDPAQWNVWAAMFADQALAFAMPARDSIPWWRSDPLIGLIARRATARRSDSRPCGERAGGSGCAWCRCTWRWLPPIVSRPSCRRASGARPTPWRPGVTVIIPERDAPEMLARALASLDVALAAIDEPRQVIVVANGAPRAAYRQVAARFPDVEWVYVDAPLGFAGAIERGLRRARYDGTYLLNNDMTLDPRALAELLPLRAPDVFALASQIFQHERSRAAARKRDSPTGTPTARACICITRRSPSSPEPLAHLVRKRRRRAVPHGAAHAATCARAAATTRSTGRTPSGACAPGAMACASSSVRGRTPRTSIG